MNSSIQVDVYLQENSHLIVDSLKKVDARKAEFSYEIGFLNKGLFDYKSISKKTFIDTPRFSSVLFLSFENYYFIFADHSVGYQTVFF